MPATSAEFIKSVVDLAELPKDNRPEIAFFGRSNVGKSSLINSLANKSGLSRSSSTPGRTRLINLFKINKLMYFVDLPGYGYAKASKTDKEEFQNLMFTYLDGSEKLALAVVIIDSRIGPTELDIQLLIHIEEKQLPYIIIANKIDKLTQSERMKLFKVLKEQLPGARIFPHSSKTTEGRNEIFSVIQDACRT